jgi:hypothetical protein
MNRAHNHRAEVGSGFARLFAFDRPWPGTTQHGCRYMRVAQVLLFSIVVSLSGCSTNHQNVGFRSEATRPERQPGPVGTFVGPGTDFPLIKVRLESEGTYTVQDVGAPEYWTMAEGDKFYPERIKFPPQRGHWSWDSGTGQLTLIPDTPASFRWDTGHFRFDPKNADRLAWGDYAFLSRSQE